MLASLRFASSSSRLPVFVCSAAIVCIVGCSSAGSDVEDGDEADDAPLTARTLVGQVDGSDVVLGVVVDGDEVTAYACGGVDTYATHSRWFEGRFGDGDDPDAFSIELEGFVLAGERSSNAIAGSLRDPDGSTHSYTVAPTAEDGLSGVYDAELDGCRTGVVLFATPEGVEGQGTYCTGEGVFTQVIILQPVALQADGIEVQVETTDGPTSFFVQPV
jgi:hypothetical protein